MVGSGRIGRHWWLGYGWIGLIVLWAGCTSAITRMPQSQPVQELTVFAAASLTAPFGEIGRAFAAKHGDVQILFNFAGSQQLAQQLAQGADADLFASANQTQIDGVVSTGRMAVEGSQIFVYNQLVVVLPADNPAQINTLQDLARPGLQLILADETVPAGQYSREFLALADQNPLFGPGYREQVLANTVSFERNVKAVLSKVRLGEADGGIVYASDVATLSPKTVQTLEIPAQLNVWARYSIGILADSSQPELAQEFFRFVLSETGQNLLAQAGFTPLSAGPTATQNRHG